MEESTTVEVNLEEEEKHQDIGTDHVQPATEEPQETYNEAEQLEEKLDQVHIEEKEEEKGGEVVHDIVQQENQTSDNTESKEIVVSMSMDVRLRSWE